MAQHIVTPSVWVLCKDEWRFSLCGCTFDECCHCAQELVRGGSVPCWVTFEGSPAKIAPRSPLHDSWASPSDLSPFEVQLQRGPGCGPGCGTIRKLQLEPPIEEAAEDMPQRNAGKAHAQQQGEPAGVP